MKVEADLLDVELRVQVDDSAEASDALDIAKQELNKWLDREELFWKQRAKAKWLKECDRNTKKIHASVCNKINKSKIHKIQDNYGNWISDPASIAHIGLQFYQQQFTRETENLDFYFVEELISGPYNNSLVKIPDEAEVYQTVMGVDSFSAAGVDGFGGTFYKAYWSVIKGDFYKAD